MLHWFESHGIEMIVAYFVFISVVGSMPQVPDSASYWSKWAYGALHGMAGNWRNLMSVLKLPVEPTDK